MELTHCLTRVSCTTVNMFKTHNVSQLAMCIVNAVLCWFLFNSPNFNSPNAIPNPNPNPIPNLIIGIRRIEIRRIEKTPLCLGIRPL